MTAGLGGFGGGGGHGRVVVVVVVRRRMGEVREMEMLKEERVFCLSVKSILTGQRSDHSSRKSFRRADHGNPARRRTLKSPAGGCIRKLRAGIFRGGVIALLAEMRESYLSQMNSSTSP